MKKTQFGFTLIELVIVITILGIIAAIAIPKYVDLTGKAYTAAKAGMSGAVKSALSIAIADKDGANPTVSTLATYVIGAGATAVTTGISVKIRDSSYVVPTYGNTECNQVTSSLASTVYCVGDIT